MLSFYCKSSVLCEKISKLYGQPNCRTTLTTLNRLARSNWLVSIRFKNPKPKSIIIFRKTYHRRIGQIAVAVHVVVRAVQRWARGRRRHVVVLPDQLVVPAALLLVRPIVVPRVGQRPGVSWKRGDV